MGRTGKISNAVIRRLSRYKRTLEELMNQGIERVSSGELSESIGFTASQIRQDLNHFGGFGQQGYGYNVRELYAEIEAILGVNRTYKLVVIGCGRLGQAIANFLETYDDGYDIVGMFDVNPALVGMESCGVKIQTPSELPAFLKKNDVDIAVITVTKSAAQSVAEELVRGGVKGIWNFAPIDIQADGIPVENMHLSDGLQTLVYYINHPE